MNRRLFLRLAGLGTPILTATNSFGSNANYISKPFVISTWESGLSVNKAAWAVLSKKGNATDAVEAGANHIENEINCCVGLGGYPDRDGIVTLDASIMDGKGNCGAVAGLERIKHPISVARKVMEDTPHVLLVGDGAQKFALQNGFILESAALSEDAKKAYADWLKKTDYKPKINIEKTQGNGPFAPNYFDDGTLNHDTMALLAMDIKGNLSGGVTTSGLAFKIHGRAGDSPIIGAGLFVDDEVGAATSSGLGEEVIRIGGSQLVVEFMRQGYHPEMACKKAIERIIKRNREKAKTFQVGFIAVNKKGEYGAYAVQPGFEFCVKSQKEEKLYKSKYIIK